MTPQPTPKSKTVSLLTPEFHLCTLLVSDGSTGRGWSGTDIIVKTFIRLCYNTTRSSTFLKHGPVLSLPLPIEVR